MDNNELIDKLNTLQAQNFALMHMLAAVVRHADIDVRAEYETRCAIFERVTQPQTDADAAEIQRECFDKVAQTVLGERDAPTLQ